MSKTFCIKTLGCKLNQYESARIAQQFLEAGWRVVDFGERADAVIINTCTVTDRSDKKCRNLIRQGARFSKSGGVIVTGCMAESARESLDMMKEVEVCFANSEKEIIFHYVESRPGGKITPAPSASPLPFNRTRGYVKIQDGCDQGCSYCIIPSVRGKPRSRSAYEIIEHARTLIDASCPEIVLTGITIGNYSDSGYDLAALVNAIAGLPGNFRLRITSIEPTHVNDALVELLAHPRVCPHLHLPLQSGSDRILSLMNRPYSRSQYLTVVHKIKSKIPDIALGCDIIVGFPGETETDFADTLETIREASFSYVHQFTFSPRKNTPAASMKPLRDDVVRKRNARVREVAQGIGLAYRRKFMGSTLSCVIEKKKSDDTITAISANYIKIAVPPDECAHALRGKIAPVILEQVSIGYNTGRIVIA